MEFLTKEEKKITREFKSRGYIIAKSENIKSLDCIRNKVIKIIKKKLKTKKKINLNNIHKMVNIEELNEIRLFIISSLNSDKMIKYHYFNVGKKHLFNLVGNELMMQKNINLSIQFPKDSSSLLPIHSDVWSGDSPFEINLWIPLVNCYKTKSMYILKPKDYESFLRKKNIKNINNSEKIFKLVKNKLKFLKINYGEYLIFNQTLPHGNVVNLENTTRWSLNCRFKSYFSPYGDKKIGEFFVPITTKAMTEIGLNYKEPF